MADVVPSPFYQVSIRRSGRNISDLIDSLSYEDCTEEDDIVKFTLRGVSLDFIDDRDLQPGTEVVFMYGFIGQKISPKRVAIVSRVEPSFGRTLDLTVTATDTGFTMKKEASTKVWKNSTAAAIARRIAEQNGLAANIEATSKVYESISQGNRSDFEFLKYLVAVSVKL